MNIFHLIVCILLISFSSCAVKHNEVHVECNSSFRVKFKLMTPCQKVRFLKDYYNIPPYCLDFVLDEMDKLTKYSPHVNYGHLGTYYQNLEDYKLDWEQWNTQLKCR